jgi:hypothetical protein
MRKARKNNTKGRKRNLGFPDSSSNEDDENSIDYRCLVCGKEFKAGED